MSMSSLHSMLVEHLQITLKKANTINIKKSLVSKYALEMVEGYPLRIPASGCGWPLFRKSLAGIRVSQRIPAAADGYPPAGAGEDADA
ncbi:hypothetical protein PGT21_009639 [Puccinia graminis f. sp. tritici]|uniref:Uncharacterized protein n=1 Tax=Puccinia graminis f. sp. tritici TaxID=56615 RepID=A0A5B0Q522_PUCGR|nr:hypothetical protein PGT21_009639 [Puccinia graminis f. sp. tritici]